MLNLFQDQRVAQELTEGVCVKGDSLAPHPGMHIPNSLLSRPGIGIKLHDYLWVKFSHGCHKWHPAPVAYLLLKIRELIVPQLDPPLSKE